MNFHWNAVFFIIIVAEISVHKIPKINCRLDIPASLQHLHQSIFVMHRNFSHGQHTGSDDFHSCETNTG